MHVVCCGAGTKLQKHLDEKCGQRSAFIQSGTNIKISNLFPQAAIEEAEQQRQAWRFCNISIHFIWRRCHVGVIWLRLRLNFCLVFKEDLVEAAILAVRRSLWEAANADFAAAVLIEALIYVTTTMWNQWTKDDTAQQNTRWSGWKRRGTRQTPTGLERFGRLHIGSSICKHLWICIWL